MTESVSIEGRWQMLRGELAGEAAPELVARQSTIEFLAGRYQAIFGGQVVDRGAFELEGAAESAALTLHGHVGPNAGCTIPCVYQLRGDRLRVCYGLDGVRPTEFSTSTQHRRYLVTYRRLLA
ncbi:TIGR03067 domain-containing protein [Opitutus sp. ER46]|uniref:TIGR03067 domain-containing protein n=1 Tax=Opitutus sp. ER46 TaxID=2161864 RepID=UPI000D30F109|nr:TIGR03067 domain-containing protein [Opitutus sp. ER46]PTY00500.1 hypothetical protein DB354_01280 [Opitutus sp. ER46]